ncbi:MAG: uroporphyrinogen decarboxylase family protein [Bacteroidota bacterium]
MNPNFFTRRNFVKSVGVASSGIAAGLGTFSLHSCTTPPLVNKRDAVLSLLTSTQIQEYIPAGFFIHFGKGYQWGDAAVNRHLEYFKAIDMDFVKIQYEALFPKLDSMKKPEDWVNMPFYKKEFYETQLYVVKELVKQGKQLAPVIATLYSPFMCAGHTATSQLLTVHMKQDPDLVMKGMEIITESVMIFAKECIKLGVDGFLASTQGGEGFRFQDPDIFRKYVKPCDMVIMNEINQTCDCNVLHICDYEGGYDDLSPFLDYPGHIVNCSLKLGDKALSAKDVYHMFGRPFMGGVEKGGPIATGSSLQVIDDVERVLKQAPERFILGAECALLGDIKWENVRIAVDTAHQFIG